MATTPLSFKVQGWGDDLRLPTLADSSRDKILAVVDSLRRPSIPLQSKHLPALKRNVWYTLRRPADRSRTGLLCLLPVEQCAVYVSGDTRHPRAALLRLRVDPQFFAVGVGATVFAATLSAATRKLWVEDVILWKGRAVGEEEPFSKRWELAAQWLEHYCILDPRLLGGLDVEMANWQALEDVEPATSSVWDFLQDQAGYRRLLWVVPAVLPASPLTTPSTSPKPSTTPTLSATPAAALPAVPVLEIGPLVAQAIKESGPDQWSLRTEDGVSLGRALVRKLTVSSALRSVGAGAGAPVLVEVEWAASFKKWEIIGVSSSVAAMNSSSFVVE